MNGNEVNHLLLPESRAQLDEAKDKDTLLVKLNIFDVAFHNLETARWDNDIVDGQRFKFVPFPCGAFVDLILEGFLVLGQDRTKKFLDVGSGLGTKVILASVLFDAYGIEYNREYVARSRAFGMSRVEYGDALNYDRYGEFDLLYYYRPLRDSSLYREFESKVHSQMHKGALVAPMHTEYDWDQQADMERISRFLYRKKA